MQTRRAAAIGQTWRALAFVLLYVVLDWATFIPGISPLGITPWNPSIGLGFALLLLGGPWRAPLLGVAALATDVSVRHVPVSLTVSLLEAVMIAATYCGAAALLRQRRSRFAPTLASMPDLVRLLLTAAAAAAAVAVVYLGMLAGFGHLPVAMLPESILRYWIGDFIGIIAIAPFVMLLLTSRSLVRPDFEFALQTVAILAAVLVVFGVSGRYDIELFYLLLVPIVWISVRSGLAGASIGLVIMQVSIMTALHLGSRQPTDVTAIQSMLVVMAIAGLVVGVLISEQARAEQRIREQQDAIARAVRLGSMGQLATALAHELNQPLTAAGNYARAVLGAVSKEPVALAAAREAANNAVNQVDRSAEVIRRLRELIRHGRVEVAPVRADTIIRESLDIMRPDLQRTGASVTVAVLPPGLRVSADLLQIEQVVTNLIRNALEAVTESGMEKPQLSLSARIGATNTVEFVVEDNGPGFPEGFQISAEMRASSRKVDGLGVGLSLCRSIIVAHGGQLTIDNGPAGARVRFTLAMADGMKA